MSPRSKWFAKKRGTDERPVDMATCACCTGPIAVGEDVVHLDCLTQEKEMAYADGARDARAGAADDRG